MSNTDCFLYFLNSNFTTITYKVESFIPKKLDFWSLLKKKKKQKNWPTGFCSHLAAGAGWLRPYIPSFQSLPATSLIRCICHLAITFMFTSLDLVIDVLQSAQRTMEGTAVKRLSESVYHGPKRVRMAASDHPGKGRKVHVY